VDRSFLQDEHVRETFLTILNQRGNVAPVLRMMHEVNLLGEYVPEFGKLTSLVQHEFYHQYTADEHTLVCLDQLDRVWEAKAPPFSAYAPLLQALERPSLLYLALLLHDVGKAEKGGDHSAVGGELASRVAGRLDLNTADAQTLQLLIEHHLLMASVSQRRDLEDPAVVRQFAKQARDPETLAMLTLHTFADAQATSDKLWNGFKDSLLWTLHRKTSELMAGGSEFVRVEEKHREQLMEDTRRLEPEDVSEEELQAHFGNLPPRYFQACLPREVADDLALIHRFMKHQVLNDDRLLAPILYWRNEPDRGCSVVKVCTWDRTGLFSQIAGSLSAASLNILSAQIFTRNDSIALDTFCVTDARTDGVAEREQREKFESLLEKALTGDDVDFPALIARQRITKAGYQAYTGERIPTQIRFDNESSDSRTVIEIEAEDRIGLLYAISQSLSEINVNIAGAKILTEKGAAIDSFYVREKDDGKITAAERHRSIEHKLRHAIHALDHR
jgi:[protein-PII] uridylyltransferase